MAEQNNWKERAFEIAKDLLLKGETPEDAYRKSVELISFFKRNSMCSEQTELSDILFIDFLSEIDEKYRVKLHSATIQVQRKIYEDMPLKEAQRLVRERLTMNDVFKTSPKYYTSVWSVGKKTIEPLTEWFKANGYTWG